LSAAVALHQAGFDVTVYERHATTRAMGGAILLNAIGMHILQEYGCSTEDMRTINHTSFRRYDGRPRVDYAVSRELVDRSGAAGWISGTMRSEVYARLLAALPDSMIQNGKQLVKMSDDGDDVVLHFADGSIGRTDLLIGADGVNSIVREQLWGPAELKDVGITVYLGWAEFPSGEMDAMVCHHDDLHQLGYAPLRYRGKECVEWWFVERPPIGRSPLI
jgi:2-polyprenyl-6-methoxyphenol hydroxylase-like FAD-dependent oxidoreductase